jgi:SpoVK/Ycf46/Vps4 family AAA+-type ATPase
MQPQSLENEQQAADAESSSQVMNNLSFIFPEIRIVLEVIHRFQNEYYSALLSGKLTLSVDVGGGSKLANDTPNMGQTEQVQEPPAKPMYTVDEELLASSLDELNRQIGLSAVKEFINDQLVSFVRIQIERIKAGHKTKNQSLHLVFTGNPGTGKTTIARIVAQIFRSLGVVSIGHLREVTREDLVGEYMGHTALKTRSVIESAIGGVLFIDEAYALYRDKNDSFGKEAIDAIVKGMEENRENLVVVLAGYTKEMEDFMKANSGLKSRFSQNIEFADYSPEELLEIAKSMIKDMDLTVGDEGLAYLFTVLEKRQIPGRNDDGNGRLARKIIEESVRRQSNRLLKHGYNGREELRQLIPSDFGFQQEKTFDLEDELSKFVGNEKLKDHIRNLAAQLKVQKKRRENGIEPNSNQTLHMVFEGNPGTGKTTIARVLARLLRELGVLKSGHLIETDRSGLVASYVGQTAEKTNELIKQGLGGVLFIDEAYALASGGAQDFGQESIDTLVKGMEDHRENLVVIAAGYTDDMQRFLDTNAGLSSRFTYRFEFEDYTLDELFLIFTKTVEKEQLVLSEGCDHMIRQILHRAVGVRDAGNGRFVRNVFQKAKLNMDVRISKITNPSIEQLVTLQPVDFEGV